MQYALGSKDGSSFLFKDLFIRGAERESALLEEGQREPTRCGTGFQDAGIVT